MDQGLLTNSPTPPVCHRTAGNVALLPKLLAEPAFLGGKKNPFFTAQRKQEVHITLTSCFIPISTALFLLKSHHFPLDPPQALCTERWNIQGPFTASL